jgi:hypothetical protein
MAISRPTAIAPIILVFMISSLMYGCAWRGL